MNIAFVTTQSVHQSTVIGRVLPLAKEFQNMGHSVTVFLHHEKDAAYPQDISIRFTGSNPFERTDNGKRRKSGMRLLWTMKINALRAAWGLVRVRPDVIILVKPLPENTLAALIAKIFLWNTKVILDVDDFELFANNLSSLFQRAAIHASERIATTLASSIVVATPFLYDHIHQMTTGKKKVVLIPTGLTADFAASSTLGVLPLTPSVFPADHTILYIGSISQSSGHRVDLLPEILHQVRKKIPDARLTIAGSGDDTVELKKQFQGLSLENAVTFFGRFTEADIPALLAKAIILIDPIDASIVARAKSSFRCALALSAGMPIVTSSIGIRTELLPEELHEKFFAIPHDASSYANRIIALINTPLSHKEKTALIEKSKQYTWDYLAKSYYICLV